MEMLTRNFKVKWLLPLYKKQLSGRLGAFHFPRQTTL